VAICDAVLYTIGFLVFGVNYAFLLGFAAVLLTMIPFLGAIVICVTALTLSFVQYGDWQHPALVLAVFGVVQSLEGLFISPKIMGDRVGLHPLAIIIAVMAGTTLLGGLLGGVLAIPLAAALRVIMFRYIWKKTRCVKAGANVVANFFIMNDEISARLSQLESNAAHLEHQVEQMNAVIVEQGKLLERLKKEVQRQSSAMETLELERIKANHIKPPHYQ
jgi:uncharacterized coiled-coil protein SlyX